MKFKLVIANILRWRLRSAFTLLAILVAFFLFGLLLPLERIFNLGVELSDANRLIVVNKASVMTPLPIKYKERIAALENIDLVGHFTFFGGVYRNLDHKVSTIATEPQTYTHVIDDVRFNNEQQKLNWFSNKASVAIGRDLAEQYDWRVGDLVPIYSMVYPRKNGSRSWTFKVAAIFDPVEKKDSTATMVMHYDHLDEARASRKGFIDWFNVRMIDADRTDETIAAIDGMFANSPYETKTSTEESFIQEFMSQIGDFTAIISLSLSAVFFTLLLVSGNTMAQSVNERISELAVLKTLGFKDRSLFFSIISEAVLLTFVGGFIGLLAAYLTIPQLIRLSNNMLSGLAFSSQDIYWGAVAMAGVVLVSSLPPAIKAMRLNIVDGLECSH